VCTRAATPMALNSGSFHCLMTSPQGELFELPLRRLQADPVLPWAWRGWRGGRDFPARSIESRRAITTGLVGVG